MRYQVCEASTRISPKTDGANPGGNGNGAILTFTNGLTVANTRSERFIQQVRGARVVLALSGLTREFDGNGDCVNCP